MVVNLSLFSFSAVFCPHPDYTVTNGCLINIWHRILQLQVNTHWDLSCNHLFLMTSLAMLKCIYSQTFPDQEEQGCLLICHIVWAWCLSIKGRVSGLLDTMFCSCLMSKQKWSSQERILNRKPCHQENTLAWSSRLLFDVHNSGKLRIRALEFVLMYSSKQLVECQTRGKLA